MKRIRKIVSVWLTVCLLLSLALPQAAASAASPVGMLTLVVEKFTLGLGYIQEPCNVPFYKGDTLGNVISRALGTGNFKDSGHLGNAGDNIGYLNGVIDPDDRPIDPPQYIRTLAGSFGSRKDSQWLGEFDYTSQSGWMYAVNNEQPPVGLSGFTPKAGDVVRLQFTVARGDLRARRTPKKSTATGFISASPWSTGRRRRTSGWRCPR